jgi:hypothetical protein|tara:strand:- start:3496 stop:3828 length:333 start_codon:yes stop_codon:yes gene_type:complete
MHIKELKNILLNCTEEHIVFDDPHVAQRCNENNLTKEKITNILLHETSTLVQIIEDRPKVYKLYFKLSERRQLKMIIDLLLHSKVRVRTVKVLDRKLYKKVKSIKRRGIR